MEIKPMSTQNTPALVRDAPARRSVITRDLHSAKYRARIVRNRKLYDRKAMRRERFDMMA